ncbi:uncharacterized protein N7459_004610 [Penicillium hispanicum]|uniref:uncharacterized protein n=1 Tax=Penicillium hispanicum TaxID=1080232 RepID=UPI0025418D16|nr:uncharacterized protein N7459_004610 [Penicillium hispanicum]KAJ5584810.1 hypothetical protein N7459_004610 [Penicillium hispanicum]
MFQHGAFATSENTYTIEKFHKHSANGIIGTSIAYLLNLQGAFIMSITYKKAWGSDVCKSKLEYDLVRVCDGDTAYFFMLADHTWPEQGEGKVQDLDKLESDFGLSLLDFAKAAAYNQKKNGYGHMSISDATNEILKGGGAPENMYIYMPVCYLNEPSFKDVNTAEGGITKRRIGTAATACSTARCKFKDPVAENCPSQSIDDQEWPRKFMKS